jgi:hypothetical protein
MYLLYKNEYKTFNPIETTKIRGLRKKKEKYRR